MEGITIDMKKEIKKNISILIEKGLYNKAEKLIHKYEALISEDIDMYSFRAIICIANGQYDMAEQAIIKGLEIDNKNQDLLCNMAYLNEIKGDKITAFRYYSRALIYSENEELREIIENKLEEYNKLEEIEAYRSRKKVLVIAPIFPPLKGSATQGFEFTNHLREFNWEPVLITVNNSTISLRNESPWNEIPLGSEVIRFNGPNSFNNGTISELVSIYERIVRDNDLIKDYVAQLKNNLDRLKHFLLIPDHYVMWAKEVIKKVNDVVDFNEIDMIYSPSGSCSGHIVGYYLKLRYQKPWIADFREEWTNNPNGAYDNSHILYQMNLAMKKNIIDTADRIIAADLAAKESYMKKFDVNNTKVQILTKKYDPAGPLATVWKTVTEALVAQFEENLSKEANKKNQVIEAQKATIHEDLIGIEKSIKSALMEDCKNYHLLYAMAIVSDKLGRPFEAYRFYHMAKGRSTHPENHKKIDQILENIIKHNTTTKQFSRMKKYKLIIAGNDFTTQEMNFLKSVGELEGAISEYADGDQLVPIELKTVIGRGWDYIVIFKKNPTEANGLITDLKKAGIPADKIYHFHSHPYDYIVEGFDTKMNRFLKKDKVDLLIMGLSYAEVGIDDTRFPCNAFNFALSSQDIYYDYCLTKYLWEFDSVRNHLKHLCICISYYAFDYDLSSGNAQTRIHRYYYDLGDTHNYNNHLHLRLCHSHYKSRNYEEDYLYYHNYKLNYVMKQEDLQHQDPIAIKQAGMNFPNTVEENINILDQYFKFLNEKGIAPTIIILPTSKHYSKHFQNNYQKSKFYKIINGFKKKYRFRVLDYFNEKAFSDEDFWDTSHLNKKGAEKLTDLLKKELF